ncbi:MAG: Nif3-like dinuclear metal center hexameric protein [Candidatus Krumholzibacteria bacterium]|nr:Nif3-like dinuclear metal center hexameric protein [Candidatus Krumholzibacteria bacterium]
MRLEKVTGFLEETLSLDLFSGDSSMNGLQIEASGEIRKVALAVDACRESISRAARRKADLLIVHHGLFWGGMVPITGIVASRVRALLEGNISLYAAHLPLDCHPEIGNNARIADVLGIAETEHFGRYAGVDIGLCGRLPRPLKIEGLRRKLAGILDSPVQTFTFGPAVVRKIGIVSGGGAALTQAAADAGCDALLTGETSHSSYHTARENGISLIFAGHYASETFGVKALGELMKDKLGLQTFFIDLPTGL